jgi:hypothetical protein
MAIGTGLAAVIGAGASVASGAMGAGAARSAARAQEDAANRQIELQTRVYDETTANFAPFLAGGTLGNAAYMSELGLGNAPMIGGTPQQVQTITTPGMMQPAQAMQPGVDPVQGMVDQMAGIRGGAGGAMSAPSTRYQVGGQTFDTMEAAQAYANANPTGGRQYGGYEASPGFQFALSRGRDAIDSSAAARGNLLSGATLAGGIEFSQGLAQQDRDNYLNRLAGVSASGQAAAGNQATAGANYAAGAGNALAGIGNARAAGAIGSANAWSTGLNNLTGVMGYLNSQPRAGVSPNAPAGSSRAGIFSGGWNLAGL